MDGSARHFPRKSKNQQAPGWDARQWVQRCFFLGPGEAKFSSPALCPGQKTGHPAQTVPLPRCPPPTPPFWTGMAGVHSTRPPDFKLNPVTVWRLSTRGPFFPGNFFPPDFQDALSRCQERPLPAHVDHRGWTLLFSGLLCLLALLLLKTEDPLGVVPLGGSGES